MELEETESRNEKPKLKVERAKTGKKVVNPIRKRKSEAIHVVKEDKNDVCRYPKRRSRVDYTEAEVPDDDHYLCKFIRYISFFLSYFVKNLEILS